jgi:hypothetical protein
MRVPGYRTEPIHHGALIPGKQAHKAEASMERTGQAPAEGIQVSRKGAKNPSHPSSSIRKRSPPRASQQMQLPQLLQSRRGARYNVGCNGGDAMQAAA